MIQLQLIGGPYGGPATEVGAFHYISEINQGMRNVLESMAADNEGGILRQATAAGTLMLRDIVAYQFSPVLTGTLRAAHRGEVYVSGERAEGIIYIDPGIVNPVYGGHPAVYGMEVLERNNWPAEALVASGNMVLDLMATHLIGSITEIFSV